mgnify:CR=1 FL=1
MTKADIVNSVSEATGLTKVETEAVLEGVLQSISSSLKKGERIDIRGFGSFIVKKRAEKIARNISKNTQITIPAHNIPKFKPAKTFVEKVKKG